MATGVMFVATAPDQYLYNPAFQIKLGLMALAAVNLVVFYATTARSLRTLGPEDAIPLPARLFAIVSLLAWTGVIAAGRVITAFRPPAWFWCGWCS